MDREKLRNLLQDVQSGKTGIDAAVTQIKFLPFEDLGYANVDHHRAIRVGVPEVVYCSGKSDEQILGITRSLEQRGTDAMLTRIRPETVENLKRTFPDLIHYTDARIAVLRRNPPSEPIGRILVVTGGTSDIPVAEEAAVTAETLGNRVERLYDVGVAGLHRLLSRIERLHEARVVIAVAGMEAALASVVGGLTDRPVIAVPTSVGYGAHFHGLASLLAMLNSCASGVTVVNIDNGFGAGYFAGIVNRQIEEASGSTKGNGRTQRE
jgi:pyridinium-3,5-biscarboxylic acid mononucleotide synthase